jgi:hypothetical protein
MDSDRSDRNLVEGRFIGSGGVEGQQKILAALAKPEMQSQRAITLPVRCVSIILIEVCFRNITRNPEDN